MLAAWRAEADRHTLYVLDVRTPEEYEAGHLAGARSAPGGQLVQETDAHIATWNARVVLVDDNGVRATMTASWLKQMGWNDVAVLIARPTDGEWVTGPHKPRVLGLDGVTVDTIQPTELQARLAAGGITVVDLDTSRRYAQGHIPGAWFAIRSQLPGALAKLPTGRGDRADVAGRRPRAIGRRGLRRARTGTGDGTGRWHATPGLPPACHSRPVATHMASEPEDVVLSARERGQGREEAMREYLAWEINLVNQMATDDDQRFRVVTA